MRTLLLAISILLGSTTLGHADAKADVTAAYQAFVDGVAAGKPDLAGVDVFIPPAQGTHKDADDSGEGDFDPVPEGLADAKAIVAKSKLKVTRVIVSKGGKSAWIAGELAGKVTRKGKAKSEPIRVSAFLANDGKGWRTQSSHWSTGEPDEKTEMCGMMDEWKLPSSVPAAAKPVLASLTKALSPDLARQGGADPAAFAKLLSDDKNALVIGSAPKETFSGGAKIKSVFKKWEISAYGHEEEKPRARAGIGPDGEMMWLALDIVAPRQLCTTYRTLFVFAKESGGWKIVHHHYSQPTNPY